MADKVCVMCNEDCSTRPRVKDAKGRYMCKACLEAKKRARQPEPIAVEPESELGFDVMPDDFLSGLPEASSEGQCPGCGSPLPAESVICTSCGLNRHSGEMLTTTQLQAKAPSAAVGTAATTGKVVALPILWVVGGIIGGAIGAAIWAAVAYFAHFEIGWLAIGVGGLTGFGVSTASLGRTNMLSGLIAVVIAVIALLVGKYAAITVGVAAEIQTGIAEVLTTENLNERAHQWIVDDIAEGWIAQGRAVSLLNETTLESSLWPDDYPPELQDAANKAWDAMTPEDQQALRDEIALDFETGMTALAETVVEDAFVDHFGLLDILFFLLAIAAAFQVGSMGSFGDDD